MINSILYDDIAPWKKPVHLTRAKLAKNYLKLIPQLQIIAITGSLGKTLTQNAIYSVLSQKFKTICGQENLDPTFRIPQTILKAKPWHRYLILEYGVEHKGEMDHYLDLAKPNIAVITTIAPTHTKYFGDIEGVFEEKAKLVSSLTKDDMAILNADDPFSFKMAKLTKARLFWYGKKANASVKISHFSQDLTGSKFRLHYLGKKASVSWKILGEHHLLSAYASAAVGILAGLTLKQIAKGLQQTKPPIHRLNLKKTKNFYILDDTYNASPKATEESIDTLINLGKRKTKIAVLGEMKDLGESKIGAHQKVGEKIAKTKIKYLITIGKLAKIIATSAQKNSFSGKTIIVTNTTQAIKELNKLAGIKSLILIKGSRHAHLERIVMALLKKSTQINCYNCGNLR